MKVINRTRWRTDQLRAIIRAVAEREFDAHDRKNLVIEVKYGAKRAGRVGGKATLGHSSLRPSRRSWIFLNEPDYYGTQCEISSGCTKARHDQMERDGKTLSHAFLPKKLDVVDLAYTIAHEFQHNKGRDHRQMHPRYMGKQPEFFAWAREFPLEPAEEKPKKKHKIR